MGWNKGSSPHVVHTLARMALLFGGLLLMPFFGVEDDFPMHPKVIAAGNAAIGAWVRMGSHCIGHGMNGFISEKEARIFATPRQIAQLLQCVVTEGGVGLLERAEQNGVKGYIFHDWTQPDVDTVRKIREVRAAAGRKGGQASAAVRAARKAGDSKDDRQANASAHASAHAQANGKQKLNQNGSKTQAQEDNNVNVTSYVRSAPYVSNASARDDTFDLATSERTDLSAPVSIGASRLVATTVPDNTVRDADRTMLRIKTSEGLASGRSEDDMAECLRTWLAKPELGPNALLCCLTEVDKRKLNRRDMPTSDRRFLEIQALKGRTPTMKEITAHDP